MPTLLLDPILQKADAAHRKMARMPVLQRSGHRCEMTSQQKRCQGISARLLSTPSSCWWAAPAFITATPSLLCHGPARHPICETSIAIVWLGGSHTATALIRTALAVHSVAPLLLCHCPTRLPVC